MRSRPVQAPPVRAARGMVWQGMSRHKSTATITTGWCFSYLLDTHTLSPPRALVHKPLFILHSPPISSRSKQDGLLLGAAVTHLPPLRALQGSTALQQLLAVLACSHIRCSACTASHANNKDCRCSTTRIADAPSCLAAASQKYKPTRPSRSHNHAAQKHRERMLRTWQHPQPAS